MNSMTSLAALLKVIIILFAASAFGQEAHTQEKHFEPKNAPAIPQSVVIQRVIEASQHLPPEVPIKMFNMMSFKDKATYPADHPYAAKGLSGNQAMAEFAKHVVPIVKSLGGEIIFAGKPKTAVIGPTTEHWDKIFIVSYPNIGAFINLINHPVFRENIVHRDAGLSKSSLSALVSQDTHTKPLTSHKTFEE